MHPAQDAADLFGSSGDTSDLFAAAGAAIASAGGDSKASAMPQGANGAPPASETHPWVAGTNDEGYPYWYNTETGESAWELPPNAGGGGAGAAGGAAAAAADVATGGAGPAADGGGGGGSTHPWVAGTNEEGVHYWRVLSRTDPSLRANSEH